MADGKRKSAKTPSGLDQHPLVGKLVPDPSKLEGARVFTGLVGASTRKGYVRLYLNLELTSYLEIAEEEVLHVEAAAEEAMDMSVLWVRRNAEIATTQLVSEQTQGEFLTGSLSEGLALEQDQAFAPMTTGPCIRVSIAICPRPSGRCTNIPDTGRCTARC